MTPTEFILRIVFGTLGAWMLLMIPYAAILLWDRLREIRKERE
ncbi:MAG: hypothetical protein ACRC6I_01890 [Paracoccaceae bacterium]